jgi:hypothetical protein
MGYKKPTYGDFRLWDPLIDWRETAKLLEQPPTRVALCHILDGAGKVIRRDGKPVVVARNVKANNEVEATEILRRSSLVFVKWWLPDASRPGLHDGDHQRENHETTDGNRRMEKNECHPKTAKCQWNDRDLSGHIRHDGYETLPRAVRWLRKKLLPGCRLQKTLVAEAKSDGISLRQLHEAKEALYVRVEPCGYGADIAPNGRKKRDMVFWSLPE